MKMSIIAVYFILFNFVDCLAADESFGKYNVNLVNVTDCGGDKGDDTMSFDIKSKSYNESTNIIDGKINVPKGFTDDFMLNIYVDLLEGGIWTSKYNFKFSKMCSGLREMISESFSELMNHLKLEDKCPAMPPGSYVVKDFVVALTANMKSAKFGLYRAKCEAHQKEVVKGCATSIFEISPKKNSSLQ